MTNKIEITRELAERICGIRVGSARQSVAIEELRALLAAQVAERQEPSYTLPPSSKSAEYITVQKGVLSNAGDLVCFLAMRDDAIGERAKDLYEVLRKIILRPDLSPFVLTNQPAPVAIPDGWKLVPVEPTELMIRRGDQTYSWSMAKIYKAMIDDAPACLDKVKELNQ